ncbi:soluble NSF attachment protein receptor [Tribonema minus]|uniref:Soluble NSF attachment protein receptor n=1 Tax=Tribonema minus TaxID=303371 RepID=A0A835YRV7_9STRA|nr:soluble NSF attachment protein receptor [Tribonema minus]
MSYGGGFGQGGGYGGGEPYNSNSARARETARNMLEMENDRHISNLSEQVSMLKGLTIDIGNEVNSQNTLLDGMSNSMFDANGLLGGTMKKIGTMMKRGGSKHMCYLVAFIVLTFLVIWWLMGKK